MSSEERILTQSALNRALLARQMLLERAKVPLPRALERMGTLQAQYAPSMYIGLWSRVEGFERSKLTRALERRSVVQGTLMRATIHLVSAGDYWPISLAVRDARRRLWIRAGRHRWPDSRELNGLARRLRRRLADGPMHRREIDALHGNGSAWTNGASLWLDMVRVPPSGTWEHRRADRFACAEEWLGAPEGSPGEGVELLVRRYLGGYGPAPTRDIANFAGLPPRDVDAALDGMALRRFRGEDGDELLDLPRAALPDPETPAPVRFLPNWDATLLAHGRRTGILPDEHRSKVFSTKTPQSVPTFLVDGRVAGTWRYENGRVKAQSFGRLDKATRKEVDEEAERLTALHA